MSVVAVRCHCQEVGSRLCRCPSKTYLPAPDLKDPLQAAAPFTALMNRTVYIASRAVWNIGVHRKGRRTFNEPKSSNERTTRIFSPRVEERVAGRTNLRLSAPDEAEKWIRPSLSLPRRKWIALCVCPLWFIPWGHKGRKEAGPC